MSDKNNTANLGDLADLIQKAGSQLKEFDEKFPSISLLLVSMMDMLVNQGKELEEHHEKLEMLRNCQVKTQNVLKSSGLDQLSSLSPDRDLVN